MCTAAAGVGRQAHTTPLTNAAWYKYAITGEQRVTGDVNFLLIRSEHRWLWHDMENRRQRDERWWLGRRCLLMGLFSNIFFLRQGRRRMFAFGRSASGEGRVWCARWSWRGRIIKCFFFVSLVSGTERQNPENEWNVATVGKDSLVIRVSWILSPRCV